MDPLVTGTVIFLVTYALIVSDKIDKTLVALAGGLAMVLFQVISQEAAFRAIDFNVIFLLAGMMVIANITGKTGLFQWAAVKAAKAAKGEPFRIMILLSLITAVTSAFLDNVTTVVLVAPVTLFLAARLGITPMPFLIAEIMASNIGGTATLIGDPPNILIASHAKLSFAEFIVNLAPVAIIIFVAFAAAACVLFRRQLVISKERREALLTIDEGELITQPALLRRSLVVLGLTIIGFLLHGPLGYEPATVALLGAVTLMLWTRQNPHEALREIEWPTLFFFVGLFMAVGAITEVGLLDKVANWALDLTDGSLPLTAILLLWFSGIASGIIDNIPYAATMLPIVNNLGESMPVKPLWWSLALGADLGGNLTIIGASANVLVANLAARGGHPISFRSYIKYGAIVTFVSMAISSLYVWLRYLL